MKRRLSVSIHPDGTVLAEASGTPGPDCLSALEQLRALLQAEVADSKPTPEFALLPGTETTQAQREETLDVRQRLEGQA